MLKVHKDIIIENLTVLVKETNLQDLVPDLLRRNVFTERMIGRILGPEKGETQQKTDLYVEILKRGPQAFKTLLDALETTNHSHLATLLRGGDDETAIQIRRSTSLNSVGSNQYSSDDSENDGPCMSCRKMSATGPGAVKRLEDYQANANERVLPVDVSDLSLLPRQSHSRDKVFASPAYTYEVLSESLRGAEASYVIRYTGQKNLPVNVKSAVDWQTRTAGQPGLYKMDANPRGCALIVNNMEFEDKTKFPDRLGSDNDEIRLTKLLQKFHFDVEVHQNKTKREMEEIVRKFSRKPELKDADCVWITFMSHGQQGSTPEDSELAGVDGMWYNDEDIISCFYNDSCPALINKPKLFTFQACRGDLTDPGVLLDATRQIYTRIHFDGRRVNPSVQRRAKIRTYSDIFIAYPTPGGIMANRDYVTGTWFIQAIVDVFSEHAWNSSLDSMFKMVDAKIKQLSNLININFQAVTTRGIGWNKDLYFNPGLYKDKTGATIRIDSQHVSSQPEEGMDVVDTSSSNSGRSQNAMSYGRLREEKEKEEEEEDNDGKRGSYCFPCKIT